MPIWDDLDMERIVVEILTRARSYQPRHHFGRPFLTSYQIAIEFRQRYQNEFRRLGKRVGGAETGQRNSVSQYIAGQLTSRISDGRITNIEGRFLWRTHLKTLEYKDERQTIRSSLGKSYETTMFRLRG
jgi:hypothetical protein